MQKYAFLLVVSNFCTPLYIYNRTIKFRIWNITIHLWSLSYQLSGNPTSTPRKLLRSQWFHETYSCGSYTYVTRGCSGYDIDNLAEPLPLKGSNSKVLLFSFCQCLFKQLDLILLLNSTLYIDIFPLLLLFFKLLNDNIIWITLYFCSLCRCYLLEKPHTGLSSLQFMERC